MLGLTSIGVIHTAISLIALAAGIIAMLRDWRITPRNMIGKIYIVATIAVCLTSFGISKDGGFSKAHGLSVFTLVLLGVAAVAGYTTLMGRAAPYVETICYTTTFFFHLFAGVVETATRLPRSAPLAASLDAPSLQVAKIVLLVLFLIVVGLQMWRLRVKSNR
ncbi:MAG: hypothetical protein K8T25_16960 [Planctomycetia bacterium]|nr:hypothetical protein [Planctomycetia bacterium]